MRPCYLVVLFWTHVRSVSFEEYIKKYDKAYNATEYVERAMLFAAKLEEIELHNQGSGDDYMMGINQFTDNKEEETQQLLGFDMGVWNTVTSMRPQPLRSILKDTPEEFDWRDQGMVTPVKNQGGCGSCWAFSGVGAIESNLLINNETETILSEQQYVDCSPNPQHCGGTGGCQGSTQPLLFDYAVQDGCRSGSDYSYTGMTGTCKDSSYPTVATIDGFDILPENCDEETLKSYLLTFGPISVSVYASKWFSYASGVLSYASCGSTIDHAVLLVGYGTDATYGDYWTIKNSWGTSWGEAGYIRISREDGYATDYDPSDGTGCDGGNLTVEVRGTCGIYYANSYPYGATLL